MNPACRGRTHDALSWLGIRSRTERTTVKVVVKSAAVQAQHGGPNLRLFAGLQVPPKQLFWLRDLVP